MEELEEGSPGKCGKRRKKAGTDPCGFYYGRGGQNVQGGGNCPHLNENMEVGS